MPCWPISPRISGLCLRSPSARGWRVKSEILTRQWPHVDFRSGWLRLEPGETKNDEGRQFALTPDLRAVLQHQRERTTAAEKMTGARIPWLFIVQGSRSSPSGARG